MWLNLALIWYTEVGIYKRKQKVRKHALDQENDQEKEESFLLFLVAFLAKAGFLVFF